MPVIYQAPKLGKLSRNEMEKKIHKACRESYKLDEREFSELLRTISILFYSKKIQKTLMDKAIKNRSREENEY